jgi:hypothetical protein
LGDNLVCAHAGDETRRIANTSFFISISRGPCAVRPIEPDQSKEVHKAARQSSAEYLVEKFFDQQICSPLRDGRQRNNPHERSLCGKRSADVRTQNALNREIDDAKDNPDNSRFGLAHRFGGAGRHGCGA